MLHNEKWHTYTDYNKTISVMWLDFYLILVWWTILRNIDCFLHVYKNKEHLYELVSLSCCNIILSQNRCSNFLSPKPRGKLYLIRFDRGKRRLYSLTFVICLTHSFMLHYPLCQFAVKILFWLRWFLFRLWIIIALNLCVRHKVGRVFIVYWFIDGIFSIGDW